MACATVACPCVSAPFGFICFTSSTESFFSHVRQHLPLASHNIPGPTIR